MFQSQQLTVLVKVLNHLLRTQHSLMLPQLHLLVLALLPQLRRPSPGIMTHLPQVIQSTMLYLDRPKDHQLL